MCRCPTTTRGVHRQDACIKRGHCTCDCHVTPRHMLTYGVGDVVRWADVLFLLVDRRMTDGGEKWVCLTLDSGPEWGFAYNPGEVHLFRDIDFQERLT